jgi:hypothetical protein
MIQMLKMMCNKQSTSVTSIEAFEIERADEKQEEKHVKNERKICKRKISEREKRRWRIVDDYSCRF